MTREVDLLTVEASTFGCGSRTCAACYPRQYSCGNPECGAEFETSIANPDITNVPHVCPKCGYDQVNPETIEGNGMEIDRSDPTWPREVSQEHLDADKDHAAVGNFDREGLSDNCKVCGLATTSDGKRHGFDA